MTVLFYEQEVLLPAEGLAQYPERCRNGDEEQAEANRATPAEPRAPSPPVFHAVFVAPVLLVLSTLALILHSVPLLFDESPSPRRLDDVLLRCEPTHSYAGFLSVHVVRRMSGAWLQWDYHVAYI
jgi:hypothetical protein